jgi:hypothetical protein
MTEIVDTADSRPPASRRLIRHGAPPAMLDVMTTSVRWYGQMIRLPRNQIARLIMMGSKVVALRGLGKSGKAQR